jgi:uncharacterized damage-inducible protein DinB
MSQNFTKLFTYNNWANLETIQSLKTTGTVPSRSQQIMNHIIAAEFLWLNRLKGEKTGKVWPDLTLNQCEEHVNDLNKAWQHYLNNLTDENISSGIQYTNSLGEAWSNTVEDILTHVIMHSAYHRGQVAIILRTSENEPAYTDFIHCVRQGFIE